MSCTASEVLTDKCHCWPQTWVCFEPTEALKMYIFILYMFFHLYSLVWCNTTLQWSPVRNALRAAGEFVWCCCWELERAAGTSCSSPGDRAGRTCWALPKMQFLQQLFSVCRRWELSGHREEMQLVTSIPSFGHTQLLWAELSSALYSFNCSAQLLLLKFAHDCY